MVFFFILPTKPIQSVDIIYSHVGVLLWEFCYPILFNFSFIIHFILFFLSLLSTDFVNCFFFFNELEVSRIQYILQLTVLGIANRTSIW